MSAPIALMLAGVNAPVLPQASRDAYRQEYANIDDFAVGAEVCLREVRNNEDFKAGLESQGWIEVYRVLADGRRLLKKDNTAVVEFMRRDVFLQFFVVDWNGTDRTSCHVSARFPKSKTAKEVDAAVEKRTKLGVERGWWMGEQSGSRPTLGYFDRPDALVGSYSYSYLSQETGDNKQ